MQTSHLFQRQSVHWYLTFLIASSRPKSGHIFILIVNNFDIPFLAYNSFFFKAYKTELMDIQALIFRWAKDCPKISDFSDAYENSIKMLIFGD